MRCIVYSSRVILVLAALVLSPLNAHASGVQDPLDRPAVQVRLPLESVLLDVTYAGKRLVAVGERGLVLLSDDDGINWRQAKVSESVTLTRVRFATPMAGWAVGHYGTILHTGDGGETWTLQMDGIKAAQLALEAAETRLAAEPDSSTAERELIAAKWLVQDGPDKPFLNLYFFDDRHGIAIGAYNLIFETADGGETWHPILDRLDNPGGMHLYGIAGVGDTIYIAGEQGVVFRSDDKGRSFSTVETPYSGSYFSVVALQRNEIILAGLRGNAFYSSDSGETWEKVEDLPPITFSATTRLEDGEALLVNQAGQLFKNQAGVFERLSTPQLPPLASILQLNDGSLLGVGLRGLAQVPLSTKEEN